MTVSGTDERRVLDAVPTGLWISGSAVAADDARTLPVHDPSTGEVLTEVADASPADGVRALDAAVAEQDSFAAVAPRERGEILRRAFELMRERTDDLALLMTLEMGKPLAESRAEVTYAAEFLRWFSEEAVRIAGRYSTSPDGATRLLTLKRPVGPTLMITPWNFPLAMGTRKVGPAVAAGCTMVVKPAAQTPLSMLAFAGLMAEAGLPDGVLNVITTSSSGRVMEPLVRDARTRKLTFTGSTDVGRRLVEQSAQRLLRVSMELGGNAPFLVLADADLDAAVDGAMLAKMRNMGEACTAANRFLVHESLAPEFSSRLAARMGAMVVGRGTDEGVQVGPLIDEASRTTVASLVSGAVDAGAELMVGGEPGTGPGWFYPPTVLRDVPADAAPAARRDLRAGRTHHLVRHRRRRRRARQRHPVRPGGVRVHPRPRHRDAAHGADRRGDGRHQPRHRLQSRRAVRRSEGVRLRSRGRGRGHRGVPRDEICRGAPFQQLTDDEAEVIARDSPLRACCPSARSDRTGHRVRDSAIGRRFRREHLQPVTPVTGPSNDAPGTRARTAWSFRRSRQARPRTREAP